MIDETALEVLEAFLNIRLPDDYRDYLRTNEGSTPQPANFFIPGEGDDSIQYFFPLLSKNKTHALPYKLKLYANRIPPELLPIGCDPGGNLIALSLKGKYRGSVYFWDHEREAEDEQQPYYDNITYLDKSFSAFVASLR